MILTHDLTDATTAGAVIKRMREDASISQDTLARRAGISNSHLSRFESGQRNIAPGTFYRLLLAISGYVGERVA